jgi:predicted O-methyltransferase YrrM
MSAVDVLERHRTFAIDDLPPLASRWSADIGPGEARALFDVLLRDATDAPDAAEIDVFKNTVSMLHRDVLVLMRAIAAMTSQAILEVGPYIGGSTVMLAKGVTSARPLVVVEPGGAAPNHPHIPSHDILGDLKHTLQQNGVRDRVTLLESSSWRPGVRESVATALGGVPVQVLSIDADGQVGRDMDLYRPLCAPGCVLFIDDYLESDPDYCQKALTIKPWVMQEVAAGRLIEFGVYGWATWIGRLPA